MARIRVPTWPFRLAAVVETWVAGMVVAGAVRDVEEWWPVRPQLAPVMGRASADTEAPPAKAVATRAEMGRVKIFTGSPGGVSLCSRGE